VEVETVPDRLVPVVGRELRQCAREARGLAPRSAVPFTLCSKLIRKKKVRRVAPAQEEPLHPRGLLHERDSRSLLLPDDFASRAEWEALGVAVQTCSNPEAPSRGPPPPASGPGSLSPSNSCLLPRLSGRLDPLAASGGEDAARADQADKADEGSLRPRRRSGQDTTKTAELVRILYETTRRLGLEIPGEVGRRIRAAYRSRVAQEADPSACSDRSRPATPAGGPDD